jgi:hypothetical protein
VLPAFIAGFRRYGVAYFDEPPHGHGARHLFGYVDRMEYIPYETWKDILPLYEDAISADAGLIDTSTRWYWGLNALDHLASCKREDEATIAKMRLRAFYRADGHLYRLALIP